MLVLRSGTANGSSARMHVGRMNSSLVCTCQFQKAIVCTFKGYILNFGKTHEFYSACSELTLQKYHQSPMERDFSEPWMYGK